METGSLIREVSRRDSSVGQVVKSVKGMSVRQKSLVVIMLIQAFVCFLPIGLIAPFFPDEAAKKGATVTQTGLIFSMVFLVIFITSPFFGRYMTTIGPKFMYLTGLYVRSVADVLFGALVFMRAGPAFVAMAFTVRVFEACGQAAFDTAAYTILGSEFPDRVSIMFGLLQTACSIGLMSGPLIGGSLYDLGTNTSLGGFFFPMVVLGVVSAVITTVNVFVLPRKESATQNSQKTDGASSWNILRNPTVCLDMLNVFIVYCPLMFIEINLEQHLDEFGLTPTQVGLVFTCQTGLFAFGSLFWGWFDQKIFHPRLQCVLCGIMYVLGLLFSGPTPIFTYDLELWQVGVSIATAGFFASGINIASFQDSVHEAFAMGMPDAFSTYGMVSGLFMFAFCSGAFTGPALGGPILEATSFPVAVTVWAGLAALVCILNAVFIFVKPRRPKVFMNAEKTPLLERKSSHR